MSEKKQERDPDAKTPTKGAAPPIWQGALLAGCVAIFVPGVALAILKTSLPMEVRAAMVGTVFLFGLAAVAYVRYQTWELRHRKRVGTALYVFGIGFLSKALMALSLLAIDDGAVSFRAELGPSVGAAGFLALAGAPWWGNLLMACFGAGLLIFTLRVGPRTSHGLEEGTPAKGVLRGASVNITVNQLGEKGSASEVDSTMKDPLAGATRPDTCIHENYVESDLPPLVDGWVGRADEVLLVEELGTGVVAITGLPGQGKSFLAAKALLDFRDRHPTSFWDWRDCREQGDRFRTQLVSLVCRITKGRSLTPAQCGNAKIDWLAKQLFREAGDAPGMVVFDNVDHYVDGETLRFTSDVSRFVDEALRVGHELLVVFTCRPNINYPSLRFREIRLAGFDDVDAHNLFEERLRRKTTSKERAAIRRLRHLTSGHPFILNVVAHQVRNDQKGISEILEEFELDEMHYRARAMLRRIWSGLPQIQRNILLFMAYLPKATDRESVRDYVKDDADGVGKFRRSFRSLHGMGLITEKSAGDTRPNRYELHPIVRSFVRSEFRDDERHFKYLIALIQGCDESILALREAADQGNAARLAEHMVEKASYQCDLGEFEGAVETLGESADDITTAGLQEPLLRIGRRILATVNWEGPPEWVESEKFDPFFHEFASVMVELGNHDQILKIAHGFVATVSSGTARYVGLCCTLAYVHWFVGEFDDAIRWAERGRQVKRASSIDTFYEPEHTLALARRDSGKAQKALEYFRYGQDTEELLGEDHRSSNRGHAYYGNIGRCLQFMGQTDAALQFLARSYDLLEGEVGRDGEINAGYACLWIGELLEDKKHPDAAKDFFELAMLRWKARAPEKAEELMSRLGIGRYGEEGNPARDIVKDLSERCGERVGEILAASVPIDDVENS